MSAASDRRPTPAGLPVDQITRLTRRAALLGGLAFAIGVILHPARDGAGVLAAGDRYALIHDLIAFGLVLQALALVGLYATTGATLGRSGWRALVVALVGVVLWVAVIIGDGLGNPVLARLDPALVHAIDQGDTGTAAAGALLALPACSPSQLGMSAGPGSCAAVAWSRAGLPRSVQPGRSSTPSEAG